MNALVPGLTAPPRDFASFRDLHAGESLVVCGCGASLNDLPDPASLLTIGVNDVGRLFDPDYLVVLNSPNQFTTDRYRFVAESRARAVFSHLRLQLAHSPLVNFRLGLRGGVDFSNPGVLPYTRNSPYVALGLAVHMGATRIGLIGVDFTAHHFFARTGQHALNREFGQIDREYAALGEALAARGIEVFNLSAESRLTAFPKLSPHAFAGGAKGVRSLNIVSYATTPVAGVPPVLSRCITAQTPHRARTVWAKDDYGNGVRFTGDVEWSRQPKAAAELIEAADLVVAHNGRIDPDHARLLRGKPTLTLAHNYMWNVDRRLVEAGAPGLVVGQYQAAEPEFAGWTAVPNPMPLWEEAYAPGEKGERICIAYTPSGRHERYPRDHRLYWHGKGYETTTRILGDLARRRGVELATIGSRQVSHAASLEMKRRAHIVIDECVTGSYHRNSLEGLAAGAVVVNGLGLVPEIAEVFARMAPGAESPFERADLDTLEATLERLIDLGPEELDRRGRANRLWMERHWSFGDQWRRFWLPPLDLALQRTNRIMTTTATLARPDPAAPETDGGAPPEVTVIIPYAGSERLPLLDAALAHLRRGAGAARIVVVEMDVTARAAEVCARHAALHLHVREPFQKARAMNAGLAFVDTEHFLWLDGDMLAPDGFLAASLAECVRRDLDCLIPWTSVRYLTEPDSLQVRAGAARAEDCRPTRTFFSRQNVWGGAVLVRTAFAHRYGGMCEAYHGYGQEDVGWFLKAGRLGRAAVTQDRGRHLHHLYHALSGGHARAEAAAANPHFAGNRQLTEQIRALHTPAAFLAAFPPPEHLPAPWRGRARIACAKADRAVSEALLEMFGPEAVEICRRGTAGAIACDARPGAAPRQAAQDLARRIAGQTPAGDPPSPIAAATPHREFGPMIQAFTADLDLAEFAAFNAGHDYPRMRRWELPFVLQQGRFGPADRVIDCSANPCALGDRLGERHPNLAYRHLPAIRDGARFSPPVEVCDAAADQIVCVNTLEHLLADQRTALMRDMARLLRPGGRLVITCDHYFDDVWDRRDLQRQGLVRADRAEVFNGWNRVGAEELFALAAAAGLEPCATVLAPPDAADARLLRAEAPYPHAVIGAVFRKPGAPAPAPRLALCLLAFDGEAALSRSLPALLAEADLLARFGLEASLVVCDARAVPGQEAASLPPSTRTLQTVRTPPGDREAAAAAAIAAARELGADLILLADAGRQAGPGAVHALVCRLQGLSGQVAGLTLADGAAAETPAAPVFAVEATETLCPPAGWTLLRAASAAADAECRLVDGAPLCALPPDPAPEAAAPVLAADVAALAAAPRPAVTIAAAADLDRPEFVAFNDGRDYPRMRRWELPFALFRAQLEDGQSLLDCSHNPLDLGRRAASLYPNLAYRHWAPLDGDSFRLPPDDGQRHDRVVCVNVLEHLEPDQRAALMAALADRLKPGGRLVVTCDAYFDSFWEEPQLLAMGVVRPDRTPFLGGWNKVTAQELLALGRANGLVPADGADPDGARDPDEADASLYRNQAPYPHATIGAVFEKPGEEALPLRRQRIVLAQLSWNTRDISVEAAQALLREAAMLRRLGHQAVVCICDNGSSDGAPEAFRALEPEDGVPLHLIANPDNRGNCVARNQIIDFAMAWNADYVLMSDSDIEVVPFSSFAMMRHLEAAGPTLGCIGAWSISHAPQRSRTSRALFSLADKPLVDTQMIAFTQYGMFRSEVFAAGVRFEESEAFTGAGWGFEDNDLAFQMVTKGFGIQFWKGTVYLHRDMRSSVPIMRRHGHDPNVLIGRRKAHVLSKWADVPAIAEGPLVVLSRTHIRL